MGFVIENNPVWTENWYAREHFAVRIYRVFEVRITDVELCKTLLAVSQQYSDQNFGMLALNDSQNGAKVANTILTLPLDMVKETHLALSLEKR